LAHNTHHNVLLRRCCSRVTPGRPKRRDTFSRHPSYSLKTKIKIRIFNPVVGEARFTSERAAAEHIRTKRACMTKDGQLFFYANKRVQRSREDAVTELYNRAVRFVVMWHGSAEHVGTHRPGDVRG
jgi:hypothetical protein